MPFIAVDEGLVVVVRIVEEAELHRGGGVDDDDDFIEVVACLDEHILLVFVQLEVMVVRVHCAVDRAAVRILHRTGEVEGLAADTGEHDERRVVINPRSCP